MAQEIKTTNPYANNPIQIKVMMAPANNTNGAKGKG